MSAAANDDTSDSDIIMLAPRRSSASQAKRKRSSLNEVNAEQTHNKRRAVQYVLIPKGEQFTTLALSKRKVTLEPVSAKLPTAKPDEPLSAESGTENTDSTAESPKPTTRPRRGLARRSYVEYEDDCSAAEDEMPQARPHTNLRATSKSKNRPVESEESDFEVAQAVNSEDESAVSEEATGSEDDENDGVSDEVSDAESVTIRRRSVKGGAGKGLAPPKKSDAARQDATTATKQKPSYKEMKSLLSRVRGAPHGLDRSLPPLSAIDDIFADLTNRALGLGLDKALRYLRSRPIRVATMCSGTESPLLALEMVRDSLKTLSIENLGFEHLFSAEIVPYKQAYIERNFRPKIIFRDITEFEGLDADEPTATTAYGARVRVPTNADIVIAGTSCVDFSALNAHKKGLTGGGESDKTWHGVLAYCRAFRPAIVIFENVQLADWDRMLDHYRQIEYECQGVFVNSKDYYIPHTRQRGYMVCFDRRSAYGNAESLGTKWQSLMEKLKRPASSPLSSFMLPNDKITFRPQGHDDDTSRDVDWSQCEIRVMRYRQEKRLGNARPFTGWQESGTISVPENGSAAWYNGRTEREKDFLDCVYLRKANDSGMYDARFKTRILNVSQNIDREQDAQPFGITGCITPSGAFFVTDAGRTLVPEEIVIMQGLPMSKISFTTETAKEVQDLAGNAMTSTVIGSAILAALTAGHGLLELHNNPHASKEKSDGKRLKTARIELVGEPKACEAPRIEADQIDVKGLLKTASKAMRRCYCEGSHGQSQNLLQQCKDCGHTTCVACGGNPAHNYRQDAILSVDRVAVPAFDEQLRSDLPLGIRLTSEVKADFFLAESTIQKSRLVAYVDAVRKAASDVFHFAGMRRTSCFNVIYDSEYGYLTLVIEDALAEWRLFAKADQGLLCEDWLRQTLEEQPVAKAVVSESLFDCEWQWRVPVERSEKVKISGFGKQVATWWARSELPRFTRDSTKAEHTQWDHLEIALDQAQVTSLCLESPVAGTYRYLPRCGKACDSLYIKTDGSCNERPLFLFLDPDCIGDPHKDAFVFSHDISRLEYDETRINVARIDAPWRPWEWRINTPPKGSKGTLTESDMNNAKARIAVSAIWRPAKGSLKLEPQNLELQVYQSQCDLSANHDVSCMQAIHLSSCTVPKSGGRIIPTDQLGLNRVNDNKFLRQHAWVFEAMRRHIPGAGWQSINLEECFAMCKACAPPKPALRWSLSADKTTLKPREDASDAARYEQAVKTRPESLVVKVEPGEEDAQTFSFGINLLSLAHRAVAHLGNRHHHVDVKWMLDTNFAASSAYTPTPFVLKSTTGVEPFDDGLGMSVSLFPKQRLALAWMRQQESGSGQPFLIEEAEEAAIPALGWRVEVRANTSVYVRGGICADHPGFGKTITSLALIQSQLSEHKTPQILADMKDRQQARAPGLIPTAATLIICPASLLKQWIGEVQDKLCWTRDILSINSLAELSKRTIADFEKAKIIIVNRSIFSLEGYGEKLALFAGVPGPATSKGRAFGDWLKFATDQFPAHLKLLRSSGLKELKQVVKKEYQDHVESDRFKTTIPSRRLRGVEFANAAGRKQAATGVTKAVAPRSIDTDGIDVPLFEMFYFNRLIVDEFHQYEPREYASITALRADKRWALSATPALNDFFDIAQMAGLLEVPLRIGSDARGIMKMRNVRELRREMTDFERFDAMRQMPSNAMHARIHEIDQRFLDTFVRRNIMDFTQMEYHDHLVPVTLDVDHRAIYTELSQHLNSLDMRIRKGKKNKATDREERLNAIVSTCDTAEEALSKTAAYFGRHDLDSGDLSLGLPSLITKRKRGIERILGQVRVAIKDAQASEAEEFASWQETRLEDGTLGDDEAVAQMKQLVKETKPSGTAAPKKKSKTKDASDAEDESVGDSKTTSGKKSSRTSTVNALCSRLLTAKRSMRFLQNVQKVLDAERSHKPLKVCDGAQCGGSLSPKDDLAVSAFCGHIVCNGCWEHLQQQHGRQCPAAGCRSALHKYHLLWKSKMGNLQKPSHTPYGAKIAVAMDLLKEIKAAGDQAVLFVQYETQLDEVARACADRKIAAVVVKRVSEASAQLENFKKTREDTVIVLNASDETAAGSNLQNANHVIFLSPLLRDNQYEYESTMAQAIGRVRRHGQEKEIHVYRVVALDTIDVDILEHRERRVDALTQRGAAVVKPAESTLQFDIEGAPKRERTQLVMEGGSYSLRPHSWLVTCGADRDPNEVEKVRGKNRVLGWEDFSSLVKFSKAYTEDDD